MYNYKTYKKIVCKKQTYEVSGGQNKVNSKDYFWMVMLPNRKEVTVAIQNNKTSRFEDTEGMTGLPTEVAQKVRSVINTYSK